MNLHDLHLRFFSIGAGGACPIFLSCVHGTDLIQSNQALGVFFDVRGQRVEAQLAAGELPAPEKGLTIGTRRGG